MAVAVCGTRLLFLSVGGEWWLFQKLKTPLINCHGRSLIDWTTILSKWPAAVLPAQSNLHQDAMAPARLSIFLISPKLDWQKIRGCLSKYFYVDRSLFTKVMSQNYTPQNRRRLARVSRQQTKGPAQTRFRWSTFYPLMPNTSQTRLNVIISVELKWVNIC